MKCCQEEEATSYKSMPASCCGGGCQDCSSENDEGCIGEEPCCQEKQGLCFAEQPYSNALDLGKFFLLSVLTMTAYQLYWLYRNWKHIHEYTKQPVRPVGRTVGALFPVLDIIMFCTQFTAIHALTKKEGRRSFPLIWVCAGYSISIVISWALLVFSLSNIDPSFGFVILFFQTVISIIMALILLPVQMTLNDFWLSEQSERPLRTSYTNGEVAWLAIGGLFLVYSLTSLFLPPPLPSFDYSPAGLDDLSSLKTQ